MHLSILLQYSSRNIHQEDTCCHSRLTQANSHPQQILIHQNIKVYRFRAKSKFRAFW